MTELWVNSCTILLPYEELPREKSASILSIRSDFPLFRSRCASSVGISLITKGMSSSLKIIFNRSML